MKVLIKISDETYEKEYPRKDISEKMEGLNIIKGVHLPESHEDYQIFYYINNIYPDYNIDKQRINGYIDELTDKKYDQNDQLFICNRIWQLEDIPENEIIDRLNNELANYLDTNCPEWERSKYLSRLQLGTKTNEHVYYKKVLQWIDDCRIERDNKETSYKAGIFPDFKSWPTKPIKSQTIKL